MRKTLLACAMALALSVSAYAGEMQFPYAPTPTPTPPEMSLAQEELPALSEIPAGEAESLTETVLSVLESVLALVY